MSMLLLAAAAFGALIALLTYWVLCFEGSGGSTMCPNGHPTATMTAQLSSGSLALCQQQ